MYKVTYYANESTSYGAVLNKMFHSSSEAFEFSRTLGDRVIEVKQYAEIEHYPMPDLDLS
jgi:hypothetical protein